LRRYKVIKLTKAQKRILEDINRMSRPLKSRRNICTIDEIDHFDGRSLKGLFHKHLLTFREDRIILTAQAKEYLRDN